MTAGRTRHFAIWLSLLLLALALQLPLILNPGYYSHDELQWAALAQMDTPSPWQETTSFQYRPLTFSLWMVLSRHLFDTPMLFHALLAGWGALNSALLAGVAQRFGIPRKQAFIGALGFVLTPYAAYTHGWIGCIADLIWLSCALVLAWLVQCSARMWQAAFASVALTTVAMLAKEAAVVIPPLLALAWWWDGRKRTWLAAMLAAGGVVALYLALRLNLLLHAPREGSQYLLSITHGPVRWLEYQLFPPLLPLLEISTTLHRLRPLLIAGLLWAGLLVALWQASRRVTAVYLLGGTISLLPVLLLGASWNHYAYGYAALASICIATAWPHASRMGRSAIAGFALCTALHGMAVMWRMQQVGRIQAIFSPALAQALQAQPSGVRLTLAPDAKEWIFQRLTHSIPSYAGVPIGQHVQLVNASQAADYRILADGRLQAL